MAVLFVLFHKHVCGPLANSLFYHRPQETPKTRNKIETTYYQAENAIQGLINLLAV